MPVYEPDLSHDDMVKAADKFRCATCDGGLTVAWGGAYGRDCYLLRCAKDFNHNGIKPIGKDQWAIEVNAKLRGGSYKMDSTALAKMDQEKMLMRIDQAKFPQDLTKADRMLMATVAIDYGLDPAFGELMIYQGRPYITIDARRRKAQETHKLDGIDSAPASQEERLARGVKEGDYLFKCNVWVVGKSHPFTGWGKVREAETKGSPHLPVVKDPAAMAEKRAEAQALRRAFHIPLPSVEDISLGRGDDTIEGEFKEIAEEPKKPTAKKTPPKAKPTQAPEAQEPEVIAPDELFPEDNPSNRTLEELLEFAKEQGWSLQDIGAYCNKTLGWKIYDRRDINTPERISVLFKYISENPKK